MPDELRKYVFDEYDGLYVMAPAKSCLFCDNCPDVFWDYTHGPYMFFCDIDADTEDGIKGTCDRFEEE